MTTGREITRRGALASLLVALLKAAPPMKVRRVETVYWKTRNDAPFWPHWTWVRLETDTGISAIGETYPRNPVEAEMIH
ncbi:MAG: mandelate racemase/muconate lactonizing enzyme family protein, partial [Bryobacteraceae bacterium]